MEVPPPKTLALALNTPSLDTKYCEGEVLEVSARVRWKFAKDDTFILVKGTPPLSSNKTLYFLDNVAANGHPAVPPPTTM